MIDQTTISSDSVIQLPGELDRQLRRFERRLFGLETFLAVCGSLCLVLLSYGILLYADRFMDTPVALRVFLMGSALLACVGFGLYWLYHWCWRRRDRRALARLAQHHITGLGDRLLGAVELASGRRPDVGMSPALCRAAVHQVAEEVTRYDFVRAVPLRRPRLVGAALVLLMLLVLLPAILFSQAGANAWARWIQPTADIDRYTFVQLEPLPSQWHVAHGVPFEVTCQVLSGSRWMPAFARGRIQGQGRVIGTLQDGRAHLQMHGLTQPADVQIRVGDATVQTRIIPVHRPELLRMQAVEVLPSYLQREPLVVRLGSGRPSFLSGSTVTLTGTVSRALQRAEVYQDAPLALPVQSNTFVFADVDAAALQEEHAFTWHDHYGLDGAAAYVLRANLHTDHAPRVETRGVERVVAMLDDEVLTFTIRADDDYGVQKTWVQWSGATGPQRETPLPDGRHMVATGAPDRVTLETTFHFSAVAEGIPEDSVIRLQAFAVDYFPDRTPSASMVHEIHILNRAAHADLVRAKMDALHARIEALVHEEERLLEASRDVAALPAEQLESAEVGAQLRDSSQAELDNAAQAMDVAREAWQLLEEGLRNSSIDAESLHMWSELVESLTGLAESEMPSAAQALGEAAAQPDQRSSTMETATPLQEDIVAELRRLEQLANQTIENMLAKNFVNRLMQVAIGEQEIRDRLMQLLPDIVGLPTTRLSNEHRQAVDVLTAQHERIRYEAGTIQDDLPGFFSRTRLVAYDEIYQEMVEKQMKPRLQALSTKIADNTTMQSITSSTEWNEQFLMWADSLRDSQRSDCDGDGEGEELAASDIEVIFGLLRARQREEDLRDQTRLASEQTEDMQRHATTALRLADVQEDIAAGVRELDGRAEHPGLQHLVVAVIGEMDDATALLHRPRADAEVIAIQTVIIEMLSGSDDDGGGGGGGAMQMMQSLGMALGSMPGSGFAGGAWEGDRGAEETGATEGIDPDDRSVERAGGLAAQDWPVEYRDALQEYFSIRDETQ